MRNLLFFIGAISFLSACNLIDKPQEDQVNQRIRR
jgi:hypothetical protein